MNTYPCAFCAGSGLDPYQLLSKLSSCATCGGRGQVKLLEPTGACAFCHGSGKLGGSRLSCPSCGGAGRVTIPADALSCPSCRGSGRVPQLNLPCTTCGGKGVTTRWRAEAARDSHPERLGQGRHHAKTPDSINPAE